MCNLNLTLAKWTLAFIPILAVMLLMLVFKLSGTKAGFFALGLTILISLFFFGTDLKLVFMSILKSILVSMDILLIIWPALLLYQIANAAGALVKITEGIVSLTQEKVLQTLLVGWLMTSFLQGMAGYGVPVAICAPILVSLGYSPIMAVVMASIGSSWSVNYGSLGSGFQSLLTVTGVASADITFYVGIMIGVASILCGLMVAYLTNGKQSLKESWLFVVITGLVVASIHFIVSVYGPWNLTIILSIIAGLIASYFYFRIKRKILVSGTKELPASQEQPKDFWPYAFAYVVLIVLSLIVLLLPSNLPFFKLTSLKFSFPEMTTSQGWLTAAETNRSMRVFNHPGMVLLVSCLLAFWFYCRKGFLKVNSIKPLLGKMYKSAANSSLAILAMVAMATIMTQSGMTYMLSVGITKSISSSIYPFVSPFIGGLGAILTGSNNNSNVLFGMMQKDTATLMGLSAGIILAAQTVGGSLGSVISPAKIIVGCSSVGISKREGEVIKKGLIYILILIAVTGLIALALTRFSIH